MAASAYAALASLVNTIHNLHNHPRLSTSFDKHQIKSISVKLDFLLDFVERDSHGDSKEVEDLEWQIASAAHEAEDVIESHIVDQILPGSTEVIRNMTKSDLQNILTCLDSIRSKVEKVKKGRRFIEDEEATYSMPAVNSSTPPTTGKATMVGFDGYFNTLLEKLTGQPMDRLVVSIVGMVGIGKTTLTQNLYARLLKDPFVDVHAWVSLSAKYNVRDILLKILEETLSCLREPNNKIDEETTKHKIGEQLHKVLYDRRYLIVLDGVDDDERGIRAWEEIEHFLPNNENRSRIIVTTRISQVAKGLGSFTLVVKFLDEEESWKLFCLKAFGQEDCPVLVLEGIGKRIVEKCKGLPLSIVVIGGLLGKSSRMKDWEYVEEHINLIGSSAEEDRCFNLISSSYSHLPACLKQCFLYLGIFPEDHEISALWSAEEDRCFNIISLSYNHLPACLKPCFLYLGIFPENHEICVSQLIKLWIAEGFIRPNKDQSLEDVAKGYIVDLVDRNLILVCGLGSNGKFKTCKLHDLLRYFCMRIVEKEKFLCVMRVLDTPQDIHRERRIIIHGGTSEHSQIFCALGSTSLARSLICQSPTLLSCKPRLLRVLTEACWDSLDATFRQVNLRLLAYESVTAPIGWKYTYDLPLPICLLWNVQTLIIDKSIDEVVAPSEIWEMQQLRHLQFRKICLPDPPPREIQDNFILRNLQTLGTVSNFKCSEEVCRRMHNIKKLRISYDDFSGEGSEGEGSDDVFEEGETSSRYGLFNVVNFNKLESLNCCFTTVPNRKDLLQNLSFPDSLKRLTLEYCELWWKDLTVIGSLPHLEVLKLKQQSVRGSKWNPVDGEFESLRFLEIDSCYLINWNAESSHFPVLKRLVLRGLRKLVEIPLRDSCTLEDIRVSECSISAAISAIEILDEQEENENDTLRVRVEYSNKAELVEFQEKVKRQGFKTHNFKMVGL